MEYSDSQWVHSFQLPEKSTVNTTKAIHTGKMTKNSRIEIIASMYTRMLQFHAYPSPYEYKVACLRLVTKFPTLKDSIGNGIVSQLYLRCFLSFTSTL